MRQTREADALRHIHCLKLSEHDISTQNYFPMALWVDKVDINSSGNMSSLRKIPVSTEIFGCPPLPPRFIRTSRIVGPSTTSVMEVETHSLPGVLGRLSSYLVLWPIWGREENKDSMHSQADFRVRCRESELASLEHNIVENDRSSSKLINACSCRRLAGSWRSTSFKVTTILRSHQGALVVKEEKLLAQMS